MQNRYPIRAAAKLTGLSLDTLRAWERRYKAVVPERTARGRQYGTTHIERLLLLNQLVQKGHAIGGIAALTDHQLKKLLAKQPGQAASEPPPSQDVLGPVLAAIESFDSARAGDELSRLAAVLAPRDLVYDVAIPLMQEVGIRWHNGAFTIAQEHLTSQILRNLLGGMMRLFRPSNARLKMVLATPAGDDHEFGILAAAMLASIAGIEAVCLGPNLPASEIGAAADRTFAQVVVIGVTFTSATTTHEIRAVAAAMPELAELWIGGRSGGGLDISNLNRKTVLLKDLPAFESECERWRKVNL